MNLLITGGAGFIGSCYARLVRRLRPDDLLVNVDALTYAGNLENLRDLEGDARHVLGELRPEVVLVDPMHPPRGNSALVKQDMRLLREVVGADEDAVELLAAALATASNRVVLKWPARAARPEGLPAPSHSILGKSTRYDVFMRA